MLQGDSVWCHTDGTGHHADGKQNHTDGLQRHLAGADVLTCHADGMLVTVVIVMVVR